MPLNFYLLTCGCCKHPEWSVMRTAPFTLAEFPAHLGLIEHSEHGLILFDTGYAARIQEATVEWSLRLYNKFLPPVISQGEDLLSQLKKRGYTANDVKWVVISHFHPDHIAGIKDFPTARFICARAAWEKLHMLNGWRALRQGYIPSLLPPDMAGRLRFIEDTPRRDTGERLPGFQDGHDLFGDDTVIAVPLPGHAVGHFGLYLRDQSGTDTFLVADACWRSEAFRKFILPPAIIMALLHDPVEYRQTLLNLHRISLIRNDIRIIPSHCKEVKAA